MRTKERGAEEEERGGNKRLGGTRDKGGELETRIGRERNQTTAEMQSEGRRRGAASAAALQAEGCRAAARLPTMHLM